MRQPRFLGSQLVVLALLGRDGVDLGDPEAQSVRLLGALASTAGQLLETRADVAELRERLGVRRPEVEQPLAAGGVEPFALLRRSEQALLVALPVDGHEA